MKPILQYRAVVLIESECEREREGPLSLSSIAACVCTSFLIFHSYAACCVFCPNLHMISGTWREFMRARVSPRPSHSHQSYTHPLFLRRVGALSVCGYVRKYFKGLLRLAKTTSKDTQRVKIENFNQDEEFWLAAHEEDKNCHWILVGLCQRALLVRATRLSFLKGAISWLKTMPLIA